MTVGDDVSLRLLRWGADRPPEFLLVHGLASNARMWSGVAEALHDAGHAVAAVDLRGHGESDHPDVGYSVAEVADDVAEVVDAVGSARPVVAGQSWGGNVVLEMAVRHPDRVAGVAAVDGGDIELVRRFPDWQECAEALAPPRLEGISRAHLAGMLRDAHPDWPSVGIEGFLANFTETDEGDIEARLPLHLHMEVLRGLWEHRPSERYAGLDVPVLFLGADDGSAFMPDKVEQMERVAASLANARVVWIQGDHDLHAHRPDVVAEHLLRAVDEGFFR